MGVRRAFERLDRRLKAPCLQLVIGFLLTSLLFVMMTKKV